MSRKKIQVRLENLFSKLGEELLLVAAEDIPPSDEGDHGTAPYGCTQPPNGNGVVEHATPAEGSAPKAAPSNRQGLGGEVGGELQRGTHAISALSSSEGPQSSQGGDSPKNGKSRSNGKHTSERLAEAKPPPPFDKLRACPEPIEGAGSSTPEVPQPSPDAPPLTPSAPRAPSWPKTRIDTTHLTGIMTDGQSIAPASSMLTPLGWKSLQQTGQVLQNGRSGEPAMLALSLPLYDKDTRLVLEVMDDDPMRKWSEDERLLVQQVADHLSLALENARLFEQTQATLAETETLYSITRAANRSLNLDETLQSMLDEVLSATGYQAGLITMLDPMTQRLALIVHHDLPETLVLRYKVNGLEGSLSALVLERKEPVIVEDLEKNPPINASGLVSLGFQAYLGVPLSSKGQTLGTLCTFSHTRQPRQTAKISLMQAAGAQIGTAIENARLFEQTQDALSVTESLYQASAELNAVQSYNDILTALRNHTLLGKADKIVSLNLFDRPWIGDDVPEWNLVIARWTSLPDQNLSNRFPLRSFGATRLLSPTAPLLIEDIQNDPRLDKDSRAFYLRNFQARSTIFTPLVFGGRWIGMINASYGEQSCGGAAISGIPAAMIFPEEEVRRLMVLSGQAAIAVQNMHLLEETRRRAEQLQTAAEVARDTSSTLALDNLLRRTVNLLCDRFGYYHASIFLLDETGENAVVCEATGQAGEQLKHSGFTLPVGSNTVIGRVTAEGAPLVINDVTQDSVYFAAAEYSYTHLLPETRAELGIPLMIGTQVTGALDVQSAKANAFTNDDVSVLQILADQIAVAVDNARSYELSQAAVEEMRELDHLKSQFLANMSHELRTPLNSIIGFSRVILKGIDGPINDLQQQDLNAIFNSGQHLLSLINDVLDLSKIEAGKLELSFEDNLNLTDLINSVMSTAVGLVKDKPVHLNREIAPDLPCARADPLKVRQVLLNLLSNASKFTDEGSITVKACFQVRPAGTDWPNESPPPADEQRGTRPLMVSEVKISVTDTGAGIAPEDQAKLFQPFSQVDSSPTRKTGGSGLGLSISRALVEMHGGRLGVESQVGKGSTFFFTLPVAVPTRVSLKDTETGDCQSCGSNLQQHLVVLAIDDERSVINLYERSLAGQGFKVIALTDVEQVLARAKEVQPFAITLDATLQKTDAWQVLKALKVDSDTCRIPVILSSYYPDQGKGFSLGPTDYLMKHILEEDLVEAVVRLNGPGDVHDLLAVDDDPNNLTWIGKFFQGHPQFHVRTAKGGFQGLVEIRSKRPDVVILGLRSTFAVQPALDGFSVLEVLRSEAALRSLPVIAYTGGGLSNEQCNRLAEVAWTLQRKGLVKEEELLAGIGEALNRFRIANGRG